MLDLSQLRFQTDTTELKEAVDVIRQVGTAMDSLAQTSTKVSAAVDKTSKAVKQSNEKIVKTTEDSSEAVEKNNKVLERQQDILENMARGFSKGQSSTLAYAKAVGATTAELEDMGRILQAQRTLMGANPFDRSAGSAQALANELKLLKEVQRQYNHENSLSVQQMKDLAIDKQRLLQLYKMENLTFKELKDSLRSLDTEYNRTAQSINALKNAQSSADKTKRDSANANSYLAKEMERVRYATSEMNAELNRSTSNQLLKFERALKMSGMTLDEQKQKLNAYRAALVQMEKASGKKQTDYISRALGPQITDIFVGLSTGQNPLTVMLQQGGQLRDQFALAGVAAGDMGKMMRTAAREMASSVTAVAGAFAGLIGGAFVDAGKGLTNIITHVTGVDTALAAMNKRLDASAATGNLFALSLQALGNIIPTLIGGALAVSTVALIGFGVGLKQVIKEEDNLAKQLALTGGALNVTMTEAIAYAKALDSGNVSTGRAIEVITEMAKAGNLGRNSINMITKAAVDMELYAGVAIADTVKAYSKMQEKPVEALIELAKQTGMVSKETLDSVIALQKQGQQADASAVALKALADVNSKQIDKMKEDYSAFAVSVMNLGRTISNFFADVFKDLWYKADPGKAMEGQLNKLNDRIANLRKSVGSDNQGLKALEAERDALMQQLDALDRKSARQKDITAQNVRDAKLVEIQTELAKKLGDVEINAGKKKLSQEEYIAEKSKDILSDMAKKQGLNLKEMQQNDVLVKQAGEIARLEWESANKSKTKKAKIESFSVSPDNTASQLQRQYASELQTAQALSKSKLDILKAEFEGGQMLRFEYNARVEEELKRSGTQQLDIVNAQADAINQAQQVTAQKIVDAYLKLSPKDQLDPKNIEKFGAAFSNLNNQMQTSGATAEDARAKINAVIEAKTVENAKAHAKAMFELNEAYREFQKAESDVAEQRNREKVLNEQLRWASPEQAAYIKATAAETERLTQAQKKLAAAAKEAAYQYDQLMQAQVEGPPTEAMVAAWKRALAEKNKAQELADQAASDNSVKVQQAGIDAVIEYQRNQLAEFSSGLSDAVVTALTEGGAAGAKKLRDLISNALRKRFTVFIDGVINQLMGGALGSIGGAILGTGSGGGGLLGTILQGTQLYSGLTGGSGILGSIGSFLGLGGASSIGTAATIGSYAAPSVAAMGVTGIGTGVTSGVASTGISSALGAIPGWGWILAGVALFGKKLFGRTLKDTGIEGTFGGETGFSGQQYSFYEGGVFRSDKTTYSAMDKELEKVLQDSFNAMRKQTVSFAEALGLDTSKIEGFTSSIKLSLKGLSQEEAQKKLQEALANANNELAEQLLGSWSETTREVTEIVQSTFIEVESGAEAQRQVTRTVTESTYAASEYAKEGERAIDTLARLATSISTVNGVFDKLGTTLFDASLAGADLASKLIEAFGSVENFIASTSYFYDNFYSDAERADAIQRQLTQTFAEYGYTLPKTRDEFRGLLNSLDLTSDSGREAYAILMQIAPQFVQMLDASAELAQAEQDRLESARDEYVRIQKETLQTQLNAAKEQMDLWKKFFDYLSDQINELYGSVESTLQMQRADARGVISGALSSGKLPEYETLQSAVDVITGGFQSSNYASKAELEKDKLKFAGQLDDLRDIAGANLKSAKNSFDLLTLQLEALDRIAAVSGQQLNALYSVNQSVFDVEAAIRETSRGGYSGGSSGGGGGSSGGSGRYYGGGGTRTPGYTPSKQRVSYGSDEALTSQEKFTDWFKGLKYNATLNKDYEVPDWMKMIPFQNEEEMFGLYLFFKDNPQAAADFERVMTGGLSQMSTDGSSLVKSDLGKMPTEIADYFRGNQSQLLAYEAMGLDPVLAHMLYTGGPEQFGLNSKNTSFTEWLRTHRMENGQVVESDNSANFANQEWQHYKTARWNPVDGTIVDVDGTIYSADGRRLGQASPETMAAIFGTNSLNDIRTRFDAYINSGMSANDLVEKMIMEGISMQDAAAAYGATPEQIAENLRAAGATNVPAYANGGYYSGGAALVGEEGPELINFNSGGYVSTASQTRSLFDQSGVITQLQVLCEKVAMLEANTRTATISTNKIAKILDRVTPDGNSLAVKTVEGSVVTTV